MRRTGMKIPSRTARWLSVIAIMAFLAVAAACCSIGPQSQLSSDQVRATDMAEFSLTAQHGEDARAAIETFEMKWYSLEAHTDASALAQVATGRYLDNAESRLKSDSLYRDPFWLVTRSAHVSALHVMEYGPERFKSVACVIRSFDRIRPTGEFIETLSPMEYCAVYVFVRAESLWKLAGVVNLQYVDRPEDTPKWLRDIVGELPNMSRWRGWLNAY